MSGTEIIPSTTFAVVVGALPASEIEANEVDRRNARSERTRSEYAKQFRAFTRWCDGMAVTPLPATLDTIAAYLRALRTGTGTAKGGPASASTIEVALSAITVEHRLAGYAIDRKASALAEFVAANKRAAKMGADGKGRAIDRKRPVRTADLQTILAHLRHDTAADIRDAALLLVGFAAALRRVELSGLDFMERGNGTGALALTDRGIEITLSTSKGEQGEAVMLAIPRADMPTAVEAVERWITWGKVEPGTPVFRAVSRSGNVQPSRLGPQGIALAVKLRIVTRELAKGASEADAHRVAAGFSGHSLRAGFVSSAADKGLPVYKIQEQSRHKSADVVRGYIREADAWNSNALKGIGF